MALLASLAFNGWLYFSTMRLEPTVYGEFDLVETAMGYEHPQRFVFSIRQAGEDEEPVELVLHRQGLFGWQIAELRLP